MLIYKCLGVTCCFLGMYVVLNYLEMIYIFECRNLSLNTETMAYAIDLKNIGLEEYKKRLKSGYLAPSRQLLRADIDEIFTVIKEQGILNIDDLLKKIKTNKKTEEFSQQTNISLDYLTILSREIRSLLPKPIKIQDFPGISSVTVLKLSKNGIKTTAQLYDHILTKTSRAELGINTGLEDEVISRLSYLTDLSRLRWVNHTFAYMLMECGYATIDSIANADSATLHELVNKVNKEEGFYNGSIGINDIKLLIEVARDVKSEVSFD